MNLVEDPRAGGDIIRYHTWRTIQTQTVASHTWNVLRILLTIWPTCPRNLIVYGLTHDMGEMSGDIQYPFKILFQGLREGGDKAEAHVLEEMRKRLGTPQVKFQLSPFEKLAFKIADNLEMWEFALREINMGNRYAIIIRDRMAEAVSNIVSSMGALKEVNQPSHMDLLPNVSRYMQKRLQMENF